MMFYKKKRIKGLERDNETLKATIRCLLRENKALKEKQKTQIAETITIGVELEGMEEAQKKLEALQETVKATAAELDKLNEIIEHTPQLNAEVKPDD